MKRFLFSMIMTVVATMAMAVDKVGTWKLYPTYNTIQEVQENSSDIYVLASGNLFSYHKSDETLTEYMKEGAESATGHSIDCLSSSNITHIAWVQGAKKLVIVYSDYMIDLMDADGNVGHIVALQNSTDNFTKTVDSIYVKGKYAFLRLKETNKDKVNVIKIDVSEEYILKSYKGNETVPDMPAHSVTPTSKTIPAYTYARPDGPAYVEHNWIKYDNGRIFSVRGLYESGLDGKTPGYLQRYDIAKGTWSCYDNSYATEKNKNVITFTQLDVDPRDTSHIMVGAKSGLYEFKSGKMVNYYDNSTDDPVISFIGSDNYSIVTGLKYDASGNLWIFNMGTDRIVCLTAGGEWKTFPHSSLTTDGYQRFKSLYLDSRGLLWFANDCWENPKYGFYNPTTDKLYLMSDIKNQDGSSIDYQYSYFSVKEDKSYNIWLTTQSGCYYLTPEKIREILAGYTDVEVVQPKINRNDGTNLADYLLNAAFITDMAVDAANRKWFVTSNGVYLISSDLNTQVLHFTTDNSPLPSNEVKSIAIDESTGVVYFGTLSGLCSYQSDVDFGSGTLSGDNVYAYPNPVTPDYTGDITIMGLTNGCTVKIVNSAGNVMHTGTCTGGSYLWDGCDGSGNRVASGVYMVLVSDLTGENTCVTKIAMIK